MPVAAPKVEPKAEPTAATWHVIMKHLSIDNICSAHEEIQQANLQDFHNQEGLLHINFRDTHCIIIWIVASTKLTVITNLPTYVTGAGIVRSGAYLLTVTGLAHHVVATNIKTISNSRSENLKYLLQFTPQKFAKHSSSVKGLQNYLKTPIQIMHARI